MNSSSAGSVPDGEAQWRRWLVERLTRVLGRQVTDDELDRPLYEFGVSSRNATMLAAEAGELLDRELPSTLVWTAPTITDLARVLAGGVGTVVDAGLAVPDSGPVAVVGLACRFPGASTVDEFWSMLDSGQAGIGELPDGRWEQVAERMADYDLPRHGGFLDDVAGFDAEFFGIDPREAELMDPQQRLLLEVTWEALAHAAIPPGSLRGTDCGVFVGVSAAEYAQLTMTDLDRIDVWSSTGASAALAANRISYALGVHGPSVTIDTACSSSLVAVHQAVRALADGDASAAVVGGVNVMLSPGITANFQLAGVLAADGRCKPFDAAADGIVRGEGCGVVVLKRLADARREGDRILAVIRGSAVNSDGRSNGIMAPNPVAQQRLLARAYARAGVPVHTVDYVEAHGTGTLLGDPIEAGALASVLGAGRAQDRPLLLGSVKSNVGHLEGAAGVAGLVKAVLGLWHSRIPRSLNFTTPNPHINFTAGRLEVVTESTEWPRYPGIARAGVSAFGFGGTNAHVVLEEWPRTGSADGRNSRSDRPEIVALSARSPQRLRTRAAAVAEWLDGGSASIDLADVAAALLHGDDPAPVHAAVVARDHSQLRERLRALAEGRPGCAIPIGRAEHEEWNPVFVFSGYGSQWPEMGRRLLADEPAFAEAVRRLDGAFLAYTGVSLSTFLDGTCATGNFADRQLALFGMQVALVELWGCYGVRPAAVVGHSMGEVAAAVAVGALETVDGLRVMLHRAELLDELVRAGAGAMAAIGLSPDELAELGARFPGVTVAVYASPTQCTVSGPTEQVASLVEHVTAGGGLATMLPIGGAGHSAAVDPLLDRFRDSLEQLRPRPATIPCYTSVLGDPRQTPDFNIEYWAANLRLPVRFSQALAAAMADGHRAFVEISPQPITATAAEQTSSSLGIADFTLIPTLRRDPEDVTNGFAAALADVHVHGHPEALRHRYPDRIVIDRPALAWDHQPRWAPRGTRPGAAHSGHRFLGERVEVPDTERCLWRGEVGTGTHPWLAEHTVHGIPILTGAAFLDLMLSAAKELIPPQADPELREVALHRILPLASHTEISVSAVGGPDGTVALTVFARSGDDWVPHAGAIAAGTYVAPPPAASGDPLAEVEQPGATRSGFTLHPELGQACVQALAAAVREPADRVWLPVRFERVRLAGDSWRTTRATGALHPDIGPDGARTGWAQLLDADGAVLAEIDRVTLKPVPRSEVPFIPERLAYQAEWTPNELPATASGRRSWILLYADDEDTRRRLGPIVGRLAGQGHDALPIPLARRGELGEIIAGRGPVDGVVVLPGTPRSELSTAELGEARELVLATVRVVRELTGLDSAPPRLWLVTGNAAVVRQGETGHPSLAALRGLVRVLAYEHPELRASWVDLGAENPADLVRELEANPDEDESAWRDGQRFTHTLSRASLDIPDRASPVVRDGAYLITGGLGGLGLAAAGWLAERGATRIVLSGRRGPTATANSAIGEIRASGVDVEVVTGDIAEPGVARRLVHRATAHGGRLRGVLHAAGVLSDGAVLSMRRDDLAAVWRAKTEGALWLHEACTGLELDWWLAYSSAAALFGSPGQAAYATANAWLDAFTAWRRAQGLPAATVQWGAWAEIGGAAGRDNPILEPMPPEEGMTALSAVLASGRGETAITRMDTEAVLELFPRLAERPFFAALADNEPAEADSWAGVDALRALAADDPSRARVAVQDHVVSVVAEMMWLDVELLDPHAPLTSLGLDSLLAMRARAAIERDFRTTLPLPLLLRGASLAELADHLLKELCPATVIEAGASRRPIRPGARDLAERWIAGLWRQVLGDLRNRDAAVDAPFGADDAAAERLCVAVSAELGRTVGMAELFAEPTIAGMANAVRAELEGHGGGPVRLLGGASHKPALFLFHAAGSPTAAYRPLVRLLTADVASYGMERLDELDSVQDKAARYVELIRQRQPDGPYRLGGWSFGGLLAFETARQLTAAGAEIELLFLIDTILPLRSTERSPDEELRTRLRRFITYIEQTYQVDLGLPEHELVLLDEDARNELVMRRLTERVAGMGDAVLQHQKTSYLDARIAERYTPNPYPGPVLLFRAKDPHPLTTTLDPRYLRTDDALGWDEFCPQLEITRVHGDHITVIDPPHVAVIAERLSAMLPAPTDSPPSRR